MVLQEVRKHRRIEDNLVKIPRETVNEILKMSYRFESIVATLEILSEEDALKNLKEGLEDVKRGRFVECDIDDIDELLK